MAAGSRQKGSQLNQLKQSLKKTGLSRTNSCTSTFNAKNKTKSSISSQIKDPEFRQKKLAEIHASQNLFDSKTSKVKFPTSNQLQRRPADGKNKLIKTVGKPSHSATQAHQRRVEKLLPEYLNRHKSCHFHDKRFGEGDSSLTPEEKALERFTKERQIRSSRTRKRNVFNLDDGGEGLYDDHAFGDHVSLTHQGLHLNLDDDDEEEEGRAGDPNEPESIFRKRLTGDSATGSDQGSQDDEDHPSKKKSKAEVMSEVIAKSKTHKYQRQMIKEKDDELRDNLNQDLNEIRSLLFSSQPHSSSHSKKKSLPVLPALTPDHKSEDPAPNETLQSETRAPESAEADHQTIKTSSGPGVDRALLQALIGSSSSRASSPESPDSPDEEEDAYDRFVRELAFDARAKPSDRLKTVEEAALEEAERLRHLEMQRLKRMRGDAVDEDDDDNDDDGGAGKGKKTRKRKPEGDDLDDDFFPPEESINNTPWNLGKGLRPDGAFGAGALAEEEEEESGEQSDDSSASEASSGDDEGPLEPTMDKIQALVSTKTPSNKSGKSSKQELAYTYPCPSSHAEFLSNLCAVDAKELPTVVERIRVLHHPSLGEGNKEKLAQFTQVLIDHLIYVATQPVPEGSSLPEVIDGLLPHVMSLCKAHTQTAAAHFVSKLVLMQNNLARALIQPTLSGWPRASELILLRLIGLLWSTSDFSHPVVAPALLLMSQYLHQLRVKTFSDLLSGVFLSTLILQYESHSKRFVPEVINFLVLAVIRMTQTREKIAEIGTLVPVLEGAELVLFPVDEKTEAAPRRLEFGRVFTRSSSSTTEEPSSQELVDTLDVVVSLLSNYSELYGTLGVYPEVFSEVLGVLSRVDTGGMGGWTGRRMEELRGRIEAKVEEACRIRRLNPIKLQTHKPVPIKAQAPLFDPHFIPHQKPFNPDSNLVALQKLKHQVKKETKGAVRELRKDARFLAAAQAAQKEAVDHQYKAKMARITASLQEERAEEKSHARLKKRLKHAAKVKRAK